MVKDKWAQNEDVCVTLSCKTILILCRVAVHPCERNRTKSAQSITTTSSGFERIFEPAVQEVIRVVMCIIRRQCAADMATHVKDPKRLTAVVLSLSLPHYLWSAASISSRRCPETHPEEDSPDES